MSDNTTLTTDNPTVDEQVDEQVDKYGRLDSERIVELTPDDAEAVDAEVSNGNHDTYDEALHHIIVRGLAEIKRARDNSAKIADGKELRKQRASITALLKLNPALANDPKFATIMAQAFGVTLPK